MAFVNLILLNIFLVNVNCELPGINGLTFSFLEPIGVYARWNTVPYKSLSLINGYKVKIWSIEEETTRNFKLLNGDQYPGLQRNDVAQEPFSIEHISKNNVSVITNSNGYHNLARIFMSIDNLYEIRVNTFNATAEGPMTDPIRVKVVKSATDYTKSPKIVKPRPVYIVLGLRSLDSCGVSIITNSSDGEPFIHNSYL
ncbi:uncharacterized protein LOC123714854 [Pieris brassicae]|uniref:uncharacterized protein LOC123714854 n=1 Tax=Pieris brassicae TaxID=7116 RepID=UPI001E660500|nr:uncharacterized protein LOC123714854 [Pieris brassicae]